MPDIDTILTKAVSKYEINQLNEISYLMSLGVCGLTQPYEKTGDIPNEDGDDQEEVGQDLYPEFILLYHLREHMKKKSPADVNNSLTSMKNELDNLKKYTEKVTVATTRLNKIK